MQTIFAYAFQHSDRGQPIKILIYLRSVQQPASDTSFDIFFILVA